MPSIMDFNSYEQWNAEGAKTHDERGRDKAKAMLAAYEKPKMDEAITEALTEFVAKRERELPDNIS
jgi:trimethylamine---corrinoid protein Co-methyltransferase